MRSTRCWSRFAAAASGCHIIRCYERVGLLPRPARTAGGYRDYQPEEVDRLRFITRGRELGFSLEEMRSLLALADDPKLSCSDIDQLARHYLAAIQTRVRELRRIAQELERTIASCAGGRHGQCAVLGALGRRQKPDGRANSARDGAA